MKNSRFLALIAVAAVAAGSTYAITSQDRGKEAKPASAPMDDAFMAKWQEFATPGADHKVLEAFAGKWNYTMTWWMEPGATPDESSGTSEAKWIFGNRFLTCDLKGTMMGMPWEGRATTGFDNMKKKYVATFIDNSGTAIMYMEGTYDSATKTFTWKGEGPNMKTGTYTPMRMVDKIVDANKTTTEFFCADESGKEFKSGETTYTRAK
jgi:hypothetical protein